MGIKITDMTAAGSADGTEIIPTSKAGAPRSVTAANLKNYVVDSIEAISAASSVTGSDSVFILQGGVLKPVDIDVVAQHAIDTVWGKTAETVADGADVIPLKDGGTTEKTLTLTLLATYIRTAIEAAILDVSDLADGSGALAVGDYMLVTQGTTGKRITVQNLYDAIYTGLAAHVAAKSDVVTPVGTDQLYLVRGGAPYYVTITEIATFAASAALIDGSGTTNLLAQWADSNTLQAGPAVVASTTGFTAGSDIAVPTTKAVRDEMDEIINDATDIGAALQDADTFLVDDGGAGTQRKSALSRIWTWINAKTDLAASVLDLDAATDIGEALDDADLLFVDNGAAGVNRKSALSRVWTWINAKTDLALTTLDIDAATDIGAALADADLLIVDDGAAGTNRKSAMSRVWTYIDTKVKAMTDFPISAVDLDAATDIGADLADADLILVDDGAGGTNRKSALSRVWTYIDTKVKAMTDFPISAVDIDGGTDIGAALNDADLLIVDDGAAGTNRKSALSRVWTWVNAKTDLAVTTIDLDGATDIGAVLASTDLILVDDGANGTNRKCELTRVYTYIAAMINSYPLVPAAYAVAGLPAAASYTGGIVYCSNGAAGSPVLAFSDGANWLRCDTLATVSAV